MTSPEPPAVRKPVRRAGKRVPREDGDDAHEDVAYGRQCFITVGATAGFRQLIAEVMTDEFLRTLAAYGYSRIDIQCGPDHAWFKEKAPEIREFYGLQIRHFGYTGDMQYHMVLCRGEAGHRLPGCIISHAGSGTILEAKRYDAPLIVVPNPTLMNNHQEELAEECENIGWAIHGKLGHLAEAVRRSHDRVKQGRQCSTTITDTVNSQYADGDDSEEFIPPPYTEPPFPVPESERVTFFDWMVLTCYPEQLRQQQHLLELDLVEQEFARKQEQKRKEAELSSQEGIAEQEKQRARDRRRANLLMQIE
ncbi:hypothetical protein V8F20_005760 [Naviculisporaceae sp. PSN 640]